MYLKSLIRRTYLVVVLMLLASCGGASTEPQDPTSSADISGATATVEASPTPTPDPTLLLIAGEDVGELHTMLQDWSQEQGWMMESRNPENLEGWEDTPGLRAVVEIGSGLTAEELLSAPPEVWIVAIDHPGAVPTERLSTVGFHEARYDQAGFLAGVLTGLTSQSWVVATISGGGEHDAVYLAAFGQGLKYGCPRCWPEMMGAWEATADEILDRRADAVFIAPGVGQLSSSLSTTGFLWFVYVEHAPPELASDRIAGSVVFEPQQLVLAALQGLMAGEGGKAWPYSLDNDSILLGPLNSEAISPGRERILQEAFQLLASGELEVSVDPITGAER